MMPSHGLRNVWLKNGYTVHGTKYGKGVSFQDAGLNKSNLLGVNQKAEQAYGCRIRYLLAD
jgi:putative transcriptional regulator